MGYGVVRTDRMYGSDVGAGLVSFKYVVSDAETEIENGNVVLLGDLMDGEREIFEATTPAAASKIKDIVLVAGVEVMYDERKKNLDEYINETGKAVRGYRLHSGDIFSVTADCLNGTPAVGSLVELQAGTKLNVVTTATTGSTQVGKIVHVENAGRYTYYAILVD